MIGGTLSSLFGGLIPATPLLLVLLVGLGITITNWARFPRIAMLVTIGLGLELLAALLGIVFNASVPILVTRGNLRGTQFGLLSVAVSTILRMFSAVAWVLVLIAVFRDRRESPSAGDAD